MPNILPAQGLFLRASNGFAAMPEKRGYNQLSHQSAVIVAQGRTILCQTAK